MLFVNDMLDLGWLENDAFLLKEEEIYVPEFLNELRSLFCVQCRGKKLQLSIGCDPLFESSTIRTDWSRVLQIIVNLVSNSLKFTSAGSIFVHVSQEEEDMIEITVTDTGIGISEEN